MAEQYSNLEVAPNEHTTQAPELHDYADHSANAPEAVVPNASPEFDEKKAKLAHLSNASSDHPALSPGVRPDFKSHNSSDAPQSDPPWSPRPNTYLSRSDNETLKETHIPKQDSAVDASTEKEVERKRRRRRPHFWILIALGILLILGVALGVGLGVGLTRNKGSSSSSSTAPPSSPQEANLPHGIFNDSSIAIVALGTGDKRMLYQENTGNIREAIYTASTKQWVSDVNNIVATNARNDTPLAALLVNSTGTPFAQNTGAVIFLFYIAQNNVLASRQFISGSWTTRDNFSPTGSANATFQTAQDSRALAVTSIANSTRSGEAFLFYIAQNGTAQALNILPDDNGLGIAASPGAPLPAGVQGGRILALAAGITGARPQVGVLTSNGTTWYNLYFSFYGTNSWSEPQLQTYLVPPLPPSEQVVFPTSLTLADAYPASSTQISPLPVPTDTSAAFNQSLLGDVDIAQVFINSASSKSYTLFGFWVNGTNLAAYTTKNIGLSTQPQSAFPFSRLAGTTVGGGSDIFLYHQINGTSFAEDTYNFDGGFFTTDYFGIATD
ncbi:hypothetical protein MMC21_007064 [Puttea exsequens]|nr:hypothetical protein [Puttea exsequens]